MYKGEEGATEEVNFVGQRRPWKPCATKSNDNLQYPIQFVVPYVINVQSWNVPPHSYPIQNPNQPWKQGWRSSNSRNIPFYQPPQ